VFGYVPQRQAVDETFPLTVREMIAMGRFARIGLFRRPRAEDHGRVVESAEHVGIAELLDRRYRTLSGGQKQRTLIARALAAEPVSAYLGVYVLLRRIVFVGIAIAQIATLGVAVGHLLGLHQAEAAFGMSLVGVTFFALHRQGRIPRESAIGVAYAAASAFTILCVSKNPFGEMDVLS